MSDIRTRKNSKYYHYDIMIDGIRYRGSCQTDDKNLAEKVASTIKSDIIRQKHDLPTKIDYNDYIFQDIWKSYISTQSLCFKTQESKLNSAKHFLPVFENKSIKNITQDLIEAYQLKRKSEIAEKSEKRLQDISFRTVNIEMSELSYFFNYCIKKGYIKTNPAAKFKKAIEIIEEKKND